MSAGPLASTRPSSPSDLRCVGGLGAPAPDRFGGCRELQKFSGKVIQLLAVLALRGTKAIVIDDADLGAQPFPPALTTHPRFDRLTEERAGAVLDPGDTLQEEPLRDARIAREDDLPRTRRTP